MKGRTLPFAVFFLFLSLFAFGEKKSYTEVITTDPLVEKGLSVSAGKRIGVWRPPTEKKELPTDRKITLEDLVQHALTNNAELGQMRSEVNQAKIGVMGAKANYFPKVDFQASMTWFLNPLKEIGLKQGELGIVEIPNVGSVMLPMEDYNPFTWIKSFTQYGYFKHTDGCSLIEPDPFCVLFQDGFRFAIAELPGVERISDGAFRQVRYTRPMQEVSVERSWVDTKWNLPGRTVTFSMLTPVINVEDTDTLILSDFSSPPTNIGYVNEQMRLWGASLTDMTRSSETIASVLVDNQGAGARRIAGKVYSFAGSRPGRPWIVLSSKSDSWSLILLLGEQPLTAALKDGKFILKLAKKSHIGIVRLPFARHPREAAGLAEFFAETMLDYPVGVTETVRGDTVTWKYRYRKRTNAWNTVARRIAPLSPLLQLGNWKVPGERRSAFNTKYGMYSYLEGEKVVFHTPQRGGKPLFGVNTPLDPNRLRRHAEEGAQWQPLHPPVEGSGGNFPESGRDFAILHRTADQGSDRSARFSFQGELEYGVSAH